MTLSRMDSLRAKRSLEAYHDRIVRALLSAGLVLLCCTPFILRAQAPGREYVLDSTLRLLRASRQEANPPACLRSILDSDRVGVSIRFQHTGLLHALRLRDMERELGIEFTRVDGRVAGLGGVHGAQVPWDSLDRLVSWPGVARVDSTWKPAVAPALDVSVWETHAIDVWDLEDASGWPVTGRGVVVAAFDTGIDVFHPDFWRADGGTYPWLDTNKNGAFDPGTDAVDLNRNGESDFGERVDVVQSTSAQSAPVPGSGGDMFDATTDWLYNDADSSGKRDFGAQFGFTEQDPTYGERLFVLDDENDNRRVDPGEVFVALHSSKVLKTLDANGAEREHGVDLILNPHDEDGHGTQSASIVCGGVAGKRRYVGVAPQSKLLVAAYLGTDGGMRYNSFIPWAESNGAHVMLYEFGSWVQEFLDGSSNLERMVDAAAAAGSVQVAVAGNLAGMQKHAHLILSAAQLRDVRFLVPYGAEVIDAWLSLLWQGALDGLEVELIDPSGTSVNLPGNGSNVGLNGHRIWSDRDSSERGTVRFDALVHNEGAPLAEGNWTLRLRSNTSSWINVNAYLADSAHYWSGGAIFLDQIDDMYTVTSPGTADSAITVASYSTRGRYGDAVGSLSPFSGQGPRIDGERVLDIAAPGHYADVACAAARSIGEATWAQYGWFGGTSAAAPHAAGGVALILQMNPQFTPLQVTQLLHTAARQDAFTGLLPNFRWGWGKLDIGAAVSAPHKPTPTPRGRAFVPIVIKLR